MSLSVSNHGSYVWRLEESMAKKILAEPDSMNKSKIFVVGGLRWILLWGGHQDRSDQYTRPKLHAMRAILVLKLLDLLPRWMDVTIKKTLHFGECFTAEFSSQAGIETHSRSSEDLSLVYFTEDETHSIREIAVEIKVLQIRARTDAKILFQHYSAIRKSTETFKFTMWSLDMDARAERCLNLCPNEDRLFKVSFMKSHVELLLLDFPICPAAKLTCRCDINCVETKEARDFTVEFSEGNRISRFDFETIGWNWAGRKDFTHMDFMVSITILSVEDEQGQREKARWSVPEESTNDLYRETMEWVFNVALVILGAILLAYAWYR